MPGTPPYLVRPGDGEFGDFQPGAGVAMGYDDLKVVELRTAGDLDRQWVSPSAPRSRTPYGRPSWLRRMARSAETGTLGQRLTAYRVGRIRRRRDGLPQARDEGLRPLPGPEVAAGGLLVPGLHVEESLAELPRGRHQVLREDRHHSRRLDLVGHRLAFLRVRREGRPIVPVTQYAVSQVSRSSRGNDRLDVAVAVAPAAQLLHDPGRQPGRRIAKPDGEGVRLGRLFQRVRALRRTASCLPRVDVGSAPPRSAHSARP